MNKELRSSHVGRFLNCCFPDLVISSFANLMVVTFQLLFGIFRPVNQKCISAYSPSASPISNKSGATLRHPDSNKSPEGGETLPIIASGRNPLALRFLIESTLLARPEYKPTHLQWKIISLPDLNDTITKVK